MRVGGGLAVFALLCGVAGSLAAQRPADLADTTRYLESVRSSIVTRTGNAERERRVIRDTRYSVAPMTGSPARMTVTIDTMALTEVVGGAARAIDVDAVIGARWHLAEGEAGTITERPFVPPDIAEVSDIAVAMDDFWPPAPPAMRTGESRAIGAIRWTRLTDSSGAARHRWTRNIERDTTRFVADSVPMAVSERSSETASVVSVDGRPVAWRREVSTVVVSELRRRVVRAEVDQVITVRRDS